MTVFLSSKAASECLQYFLHSLYIQMSLCEDVLNLEKRDLIFLRLINTVNAEHFCYPYSLFLFFKIWGFLIL